MSQVTVALVLALAIAVAVFGWVLVRPDEAWFLEVIRRMQRGDRLYQDVFFGAGPVPIWLARLAVGVSRPQIAVIRALTIGYVVSVWVTGVLLLVAADGSTLLSILFIAAAVGLGGQQLAVANHYAEMSTVGVIIAALGVVQSDWLITGVGLLLGLSGKYSLGVFAAAWALPLLVIDGGMGEGVKAVAVIVTGLVIIALILGGRGVRSFLSVAVANKAAYISTGAVRPVGDVLRRLRIRHPSVGYRMSARMGPIAVLLVAGLGVVGAMTGLVFGIADGSTVALVAAALCATGLVGAFPRADFDHLVAAMPLVVLGLCLLAGWFGVPSGVLALAGTVVLVVLAGGVLALALGARNIEVRRDLAHLRLFPVPIQSGVWPDETAELRAIAGDEVFMLRRDAPFFYLAGSLRNPTPYDYPLASTFGPHGQRRVAEDIRLGVVRWTCHEGPMGGPLAPRELEQFVASMTPVASTPPGALYDSHV